MFNNNNQFYPTPDNIINKMLLNVDFSQIKTILEPSAGKGDIVESLEQKNKRYTYQNQKIDIDCIEIDENLQHILRGKGYKVVHDDFLTFNTMKQYDLIVMNPPFNNGDKHLLKALEMQEQNGGGVICILNAETLKNPYSNARKDLQQKLTEYNAQVEFIQDSFIDAERQTKVEIAIIRVELPKIQQESFILNGLKKAQKQREYVEQEQNSLVENDIFKAIVNQYDLEVKAGVNLIKEYYAMSPFILSEFTKEGQKGDPILKLVSGSRYTSSSDIITVNKYIEEVRKKYWRALFHNHKFIGNLTNNLRDEFYNSISDLIQYDFTLYNIYQLKLKMNNNLIRGIEDTIIALFDELSHKYHYSDSTSSNIHYYNGWKTNKSWIINKKVIIRLNAYNNYNNRYNPCYYTIVDKLKDIEKCLNYLDGGLTEAKDLEEQLQQAEELNITKKITLKYFTVTFYKKGTCHIEFTNLELLKKFNIFGSQSKGWLPPSYGKSQYKDMATEEKQVINEFEGEKEYNNTLANSKYYIFNTNKIMMLEDAEQIA